MPIKRSSLFALLIILAVLACALVPITHQARQYAQISALKKNGRDVWFSVWAPDYNDRDLEKFPHDYAMPLPEKLLRIGISLKTAEDYFTYLMSDGTSGNSIARRRDYQITPLLNSEMLVANGMKPAQPGTIITSEANIWHVVCLSINSSDKVPFLVTRNVRTSDIRYAKSEAEIQKPDNTPRMGFDKNFLPQIGSHIIWTTRGGVSLSIHEKKLFPARLCPVVQPDNAPIFQILPAAGGYVN